MLDVLTFKKFIGAANRAHQQLCVWRATNNEFAKNQKRWNEWTPDKDPFPTEKFTRRNGCKYKNFWSVAVASIQHGWMLGAVRLFDPAYHPGDKKKERPRISLHYILELLQDPNISASVEAQLKTHEPVIESLKDHRDNVLAHNDATFTATHIEAGVEKLYEWLETVIADIKKSHPHLADGGVINVEYNEKLSQCGVDEVFETLLLGEKYE